MIDVTRNFCAIVFLLLAAMPLAHAQEARVIVKYRAGSTLAQQTSDSARLKVLSGIARQPVSSGRKLAPRLEVLRAQGVTSEQLAAQLRSQADVEYAVPDGRKFARAMPNDPLYSSQWYLQSAEAAAIRADQAWDVTTGNAGIVIAVLDTGVRADHPDLAGKFVTVNGSVYGYDFISDLALSNDGDLRDADPSDPGDFVSSADRTSRPDLFSQCGVSDSSWHGTQVSGIIAAATNNSVGVAGVAWQNPILPVRVLGKCGGFDSDIIAGMRWAAGLAVPGVPANAAPAKVINISLGAQNQCGLVYRDAIAEINAAGAVVVASAGNESGPVHEPANCPGVLSVAGIRHNGIKVGYSSYGIEVGVAAPAGNCVNATGACLFPIVTTSNSGATAPASHIYTDNFNATLGTSFSAPQAAGVAGLMLSLHPALRSHHVIDRIRASARAFPSDASLPSCNVGVAPGTAQCNCTTTTCGAGMLDAPGAVAQALRPAANIVAPTNPPPGVLITLSGTDSSAASGRNIVSYQWSLLAGNGVVSVINSPTQAVTTLLPAIDGSFTVSLTVVDDTGASDTAATTIIVGNPAPPAPPSTGGGGGGGGGSLDLLSLLAVLLLGGLAYFTDRRARRSKKSAA